MSGPGKLLERDMVLVSIQYRLMSTYISLLHQDYGTKNISTKYSIILICKTLRVGPLGFMCLPDDEIPGNAGLLDQVKHFHHQFCHFVIVIIFASFHLNF